MSLFGDDDDNTLSPSRSGKSSGLFDDDRPSTRSVGGKAGSTSMFGDDTGNEGGGGDDSSPWGFTSRKSAGRGSLVQNLLADTEVPDSYIDRFDALQVSRAVGAGEAKKLLAVSGIAPVAQERILEIVAGRDAGARLGRGEFNVLLALIGLAQEGEELSLDAVDERRSRLPLPRLPALGSDSSAVAVPASQPPATATMQACAQHPERQHAQQASNGGVQSQTYGASFGESDPWGSPATHRANHHLNGSSERQRTTSSFTTTAAEPSDMSASGSYSNPSAGGGGGDSTNWGRSEGYTASSGVGFGSSAIGAGGSGGFGGDEGRNPALPTRVVPTRTATSKGVEEVVTVALLDEKEGMFMFQHRNYEVSSVRRNSKVIRRYSDFVWLLDCLHKRYPFRQLPLLPPKRVQINGNHIAADGTFLEKRRRGLARFANSLVRHPILREEQLVVMFLTVPTELAVWRKQATISVQEEFAGKSLPPNLEDSLPQNLSETFDIVRSGVRRSADLYINLCNIVERLCKRKEAIAAEYGRFATNMTSLTDSTGEVYAIDPNDVPLLNDGLNNTARHLGASRALLDDEARAWDLGVLDDLKSLRDAYVSFRDLFDRRDRLARDNIPQLERRIVSNESKLQGIKAKGDAAKPGEAEKVENAIVNDKQSIVEQHARGVFIRECVRDELLTFQHSIGRVSYLLQDWAQERVKYAELQADTFRRLVDAVENMPSGE